MKKRGVAALELLAMDMKAAGAYVSRMLGFTGCNFEIIKTKLSKESLDLYERCVVLWNQIRVAMIDAIQRLDNKTKRTLWSAFWSTHQRFFKQLCLVLKLPYVLERAKKALENDCCVVIGIQTTGEASLNAAIEELGVENAAKGSMLEHMILHFLRNHFPVRKLEENNEDDNIEKMKQPKTIQHKRKISKSITDWWVEKKENKF